MTTDVENEPTLYGFDPSTYTQIVLLILAGKGVASRYIRVANWAGEIKLRDYRDLNPFDLIPVFNHGNTRLYETTSIAEYIDEYFPGRSLRPISAAERARMWQLIAI